MPLLIDNAKNAENWRILFVGGFAIVKIYMSCAHALAYTPKPTHAEMSSHRIDPAQAAQVSQPCRVGG